MFDDLNVDFQFEVGRDERHVVAFQWRQSSADATIEIDGAEALHERHPFGMKRRREYRVSVGTVERHVVVIEKLKPKYYGGVRANTFRVFVDGELIAEHRPANPAPSRR